MRYEYRCSSCTGSVLKPQCGAVKDDEGKIQDYAGLGHWSCANCGSSVKVKRTLRGEKV